MPVRLVALCEIASSAASIEVETVIVSFAV